MWRSRYREVRRGVALIFLAVTVTGFVVLPAILDPEDVSKKKHYTAQATPSTSAIHKILGQS